MSEKSPEFLLKCCAEEVFGCFCKIFQCYMHVCGFNHYTNLRLDEEIWGLEVMNFACKNIHIHVSISVLTNERYFMVQTSCFFAIK